MTDSTNDLPDEECYICGHCHKKIHRSWVRRYHSASISGDLICCGRPMSRTMRVTKTAKLLLQVASIWLLAGPFILYFFFGAPIWTAIWVTVVSSFILGVIAIGFSRDMS